MSFSFNPTTQPGPATPAVATAPAAKSFSFGSAPSAPQNQTLSLFGATKPAATSATPASGGLFGSTPAVPAAPANSSAGGLFGSAQPSNQAPSSANTSLFNSVTTSNGPSLFGSNSNQAGTASFFNNNNNNANSNSNSNNGNIQNTNQIQSSVDMGNLDSYSAYSSRRATPAPAWAPVENVKHIPSHLSIMRHDSSFNNPDRPAQVSGSSFRRSVNASSPSSHSSSPNSFGSSFGTPRPAAFKKKTNIIGDEDLPPTQSIYDSGASTFIPAGISRSMGAGDHSNTYRLTASSSPAVAALPFSSSSNTATFSIYAADANAVIIFGFPPSLIPAVVSHFSRFGTILENISSASEFRSTAKSVGSLRPIQSGKNWLKITYESPSSAARALSENGTIFADNYAIGCIPCTPQNLKQFSDASAKNMNDQLSSRQVDPMVSLIDLDTPLSSANGADTDADSNINGDTGATAAAVAELSTLSSIYPKLGTSTSMASVSTDHSARPLLAGAKKLEIQNGQSIFKERERSNRLWGVVGVGAGSGTNARPLVGAHGHTTGLALNARRDSWLGWAVKKTQEMVFGWEDL
ncbi:MPPN-domain-containing protein [Nadsonia fulvescens var. elongata DSM 6958]|uniref:MPPN-domain-containing protein n=1 Tax=Nadsonia fulvescens var. elongata DSM 6958 TaxID=857566 RepID=A0A1E3PI14_9ASCO|nr:MPPN-domain-containing protein [Nadsonia fulvescens var. elongata DSM 6958]